MTTLSHLQNALGKVVRTSWRAAFLVLGLALIGLTNGLGGTLPPPTPASGDYSVQPYFSSEFHPKDTRWFATPWSATDPNWRYKMSPQTPLWLTVPATASWPTINVNSSQTFQPILGMGTSLEETSIYALSKNHSDAQTEQALTDLIDPVNGIGMNLFRICIGTSDFSDGTSVTNDPTNNPHGWYTYQDGGATAPFSIQNDITLNIVHTILLAEAVATQTNHPIKIFASAWSPPAWMKDSNSLSGGNLLTSMIPAYATYLREFVQAYQAQGIPIYAITTGNEHYFSTTGYPSCYFTPQQETTLVSAIATEFAKYNITTKVWILDHNYSYYNQVDQTLAGLGTNLSQVDSVAYHHYAGDPSNMSVSHTAYPSVATQCTEGSDFGTAGMNEIVQDFRNWSSSYVSWVTMTTQTPSQIQGPYNAPPALSPTLMVRNNNTETGTDPSPDYYKIPEYYLYGQFMKFIQPGAVRIYSDAGSTTQTTNVAFKNPDGTIVIVAVNQNNWDQDVRFVVDGNQFNTAVPAATVATYVMKGGLAASTVAAMGLPTLSPSISPPTGSGSFVQEWFLNISNVSLSSLENDSRYPNSPSGANVLTTLHTNDQWTVTSGTHMTGCIVPNVTGAYTFYFQANSLGEFRLSTDSTKAHLSTSPTAYCYTYAIDWTSRPGQISAPVNLVAGQKYYFETVQAGGGGNGESGVAWDIPGIDNGQVISGNFLAPSLEATPPAVTSVLTAPATTQTAFTYQITGSNTPFAYTASGLPAGLTLNTSTGAITGKPTTTGSYRVAIAALNVGGQGTANLVITVAANTLAPVFTSPTTASGVIGSAFNYAITATNSPTSYAASSLPKGLSVNTTTGVISGTPTTAGNSNVTLSATNAYGTVTQVLAVSITATSTAPVISSATTASGVTGTAFTYTITASNTPTSFNATNLPPGLVVSTTTGVISGTPSATGTTAIALSATNAQGTGTGTLTLTVTSPIPPAPVISSATTGSGTVGTAFSYAITASNSPTSFNATGLPAGLGINTTSGVISGTPTGTGTSTVSLSATNAGGTGTATLALSVNTTNSVPSGYASADVGSPALTGSAVLTAPGTYTVTSGGADIWGTSDQFHFVDVPWVGDGVLVAHVLDITNTNSAAKAGLMFRQSLANNSSNALVDITPGSGSEFNDRATTGGSSSTSNTPGITAPKWIKLVRTANSFSAFSSADGVTWASVPLAGTAITVTTTDPIYAGLIVTSHNATTLGTAHFDNVTFLATPSGLAGSATAAQVALSWSANPNQAVTSETAYAVERSPSGANTWTVLTSTLPVGTVSYVDTTIASGQSYDYRVRSLAANGQASSYDTITVLPSAPAISSATTATATVGSAFTYSITASSTPTSFNATGLPDGLAVNTATGVISGTPTAIGSSQISLSATNAGGTGTATLTLTVNPPVPVISSSLTATVASLSAFSYTITASNSPTGFNATSLPPGLSVDTGTGIISGTPTTAGSYSVALSASNAGGAGTATLNLTVTPPVPVLTSSNMVTTIDNTGFNYAIAANYSPTSFNATGLPAGLTINPATGVISGIPTATGVFQVTLAATNAYGTGTETLTLTLNAPPTLLWTGASSGSWDTASVNWLNGSTATAYADPDYVVFDDTASGGTITLSGSLNPSGVTVATSTKSYTLAGILSGTTTLTKSGTTSLSLTGANTYSGGTLLLGGQLAISASAKALGTGMLTLGSAGDTNTVVVRANTINPANAVTVNAGGSRWIEPGNGNAVTYSGAIVLNGGATVGFSTIGGNITSSGGITGTGNILLGENGGARGNSETLSGGAVNNVGTISDAGNPDTGGAFISANIGANVTGITQNSASESMTLSGTNAFNGPITITLGTLTLGGTGTLGNGTYSGTISDVGTLVDNSTADQTLSGVISGAGKLTVSGTGYLTLGGANTYTGITTVNPGAVLLINQSITSPVAVSSGGILGGSGTINNGVTVVSGGLISFNVTTGGVAGLTVNGNLSLTGTIYVEPAIVSGSLAAGTYTIMTYTGTLTGSPTFVWTPPNGSTQTATINTSTAGKIQIIVQ